MLLNFMQKFTKNLHYSFGERDFINSNKNDQLEYPHVSFPLKNLERLVVTKQFCLKKPPPTKILRGHASR